MLSILPIGGPAETFATLSAHILRSPRCSDSVCFLRDCCRVNNVVGRRTP